MPLRALRVDDRWLWLGLGVGIFVALKAIHAGIQSVHKLSKTHEESKRFGVCTVSQETEDGSSTSSDPPHPVQTLMEETVARDPCFIKAHITGHIKDFDPEGWLAPWSLTCSICKAIDGESLKILATSNNYDIRQAAARILVDRFLSCPSEFASLSADLFAADPYKRDLARRAVDMLERYADPSYGRRVEVLKKQAGLTTVEPSLSDPSNMSAVSGNARRRHREESPEEQALRRRRREAIVINEGDRPLSQSDIIQRRTTG